MAGAHKHKWTWVVKYAPEHFGEKGFHPPTSRERPAINLSQISAIAERQIASGTAKLDGGKVLIDLPAMGYEKVIGKGVLTVPVKIIARSWAGRVEHKLASFNSEIVKAG
jgi:large subunit ribosomal protein L15